MIHTLQYSTKSLSLTVHPDATFSDIDNSQQMNLHPHSSKNSGSLMNQSYLASLETSNSDAIDTLYVNSVIANVRSTSSQEHRGKLWESLHKSLLQVKSTRAALEAIAAAEHDTTLNVLEQETRDLFYKLKQECKAFGGDWGQEATAATAATAATIADTAATIVPEFLSAPTHIPTMQSSLSPRQSTSIIDRALGVSDMKKIDCGKEVSTWTIKDRHTVAENTIKQLRTLAVLAQTRNSYGYEQQLIAFVRDQVFLRIEPCKEFCLASSDVSNLVVDLLITHAPRLPVSKQEMDSLHDWRDSSVLATAIAKVLNNFYFTNLRRQSRNTGRKRSRRKVRFRCCNISTLKIQDTSAAMAASADETADRLLLKLQQSISTLTSKNSRSSYEEVQTIVDVYYA